MFGTSDPLSRGVVMLKRRTWIAVATAGALGVAGIGTGVAMATSSTTSHTLKFNSVQISTKQFGFHFVDADKDMRHGKQIGNDIVDGVFNPQTQTFKINFAGALKGGIIYGRGTGNAATGAFTGKVTGGTGKYKGVKGTAKGTGYGSQNQNEHLTLVYHH
jgi:hypothetical protein